MRVLVLLSVLALMGCESSAEERARIQRENDTADHQTCAGYGLTLGSPAYADCRLRLAQMRADRRAAIAEMWRQNQQQQQQQRTPAPGPVFGSPNIYVPPTQNTYVPPAPVYSPPPTPSQTRCYNTPSGVSCVTN